MTRPYTGTHTVCVVISEDGDFRLYPLSGVFEAVEFEEFYTIVIYKIEKPTFFIYWEPKDPRFISIAYEPQGICGEFVAHYFDEAETYGLYEVEEYLELGEKLFADGPDGIRPISTQRPL